ncbi:MAG: c-type cytochrome [Crocinitomicaceae bacterium]|jgi:cytochrome c551/c552/RNA polymerase-binding transcription factor DksA|nr:c-type cytochrome [Crocinitomicaceae bacterium]
MKISSSQMFRKFRNWYFSALAIVIAAGISTTYAQGDGLFKAKCASCHQPHKNGTGPKLFQVRQKWADGGAKDGSIYQWVNNWQTAAANDPYAQTVSAWSPTAMQAFPELKKEDVDAILDWVDSQPEPGADAKDGAAGDAAATDSMATEEEESSNGWVWILMGVVFATIIMAVSGVRRQLKIASAEDAGEDTHEGKTYMEEFKTWAWKYRKYVGMVSLVIVIGAIVTLFLSLYSIGVVEEYQPSQPIAFPHAIHTGTNGIDCKYCHNSVTKSKSAGLPTVNVCMNCHKQVNGRTPAQQEQIAKIYEAAGWNPEGAGKYTGKVKPIIWNKVHVLPDHVYFNHSQHVVVGGVDCKQCHGDMTKQVEAVKVQTVAELNKIEGNIPLTKPTLTMGWCIECHGEKEISTGSIADTKKDGYYQEIHRRLLNNDKKLYSKYLKDGKVTVSELGGWECAKCHY